MGEAGWRWHMESGARRARTNSAIIRLHATSAGTVVLSQIARDFEKAALLSYIHILSKKSKF